ncbi:MAG: tetratricopeptide repeat protein [bacterium]|nr:tetratricopeptide repeat protein [bacterium]
MKINYFFCLFLCSSLAFATPKDNYQPLPKSLEANEKGAIAMKSHDSLSAEKLFKEAYDLDQNNITAAYNLAGAYVVNHKEALAISLLNETIKKSDKDPELYVRLGDTYFSNQDIDKAAKAYEKALALDPSIPNVAMKLGTIYSMKNKLKDAEKMLTKAVEQAPLDPQALSNLASILLANNKAEESIRAAKKSLQQKVAANTYLTLGQAYDSMKDGGNALISYQKAIALGEKNPKLLDRVNKLKEIVKEKTAS